jgi:hypothetical protein
MVRVNGQGIIFTAKMPGVDRGTVRDWLDAYARNCLVGLADDARPGRHPVLVWRSVNNYDESVLVIITESSRYEYLPITVHSPSTMLHIA